MPRPLTDEQRKAIIELRHLPMRDNAKRNGVSLGAVSKVLAEADACSEATPRAAAVAPTAPIDLAASDEATLTASLAALHEQRAEAKANRDLARSIQVEKAIADVTARRARLRPPAPENPDASPKWQELATQFRAQAHAKLDRILNDAGVK